MRYGDPEHHAAAAAFRQQRGDGNEKGEEADAEQLHEQKLSPGCSASAVVPQESAKTVIR